MILLNLIVILAWHAGHVIAAEEDPVLSQERVVFQLQQVCATQQHPARLNMLSSSTLSLPCFLTLCCASARLTHTVLCIALLVHTVHCCLFAAVNGPLFPGGHRVCLLPRGGPCHHNAHLQARATWCA